MAEVFSVTLKSGEKLSGYCWKAENAVRSLAVITGMNEYALRYRPFAESMNTRGVNVWVLDAFGQGLNAESVEKQQIWPVEAFAKNVDAVALMVEKAAKDGLPVSVMGHSMGSFMVQSLMERYPRIADKVILCGSNGGQRSLMTVAYGLAKILVNRNNREQKSPVLQNLGLGGFAKAVKDRRTDFDWLSYNEDNVREYISDPWCGHENTGGFWLEFLRGMSTIWSPSFLSRISKDERILIIAGAEDPVGQNGKGPAWLEDTYRKLGIKNVRLIIYPHMRHEILREKDGQKVMDDIAAFLEE